jgi:hypothetical protein
MSEFAAFSSGVPGGTSRVMKQAGETPSPLMRGGLIVVCGRGAEIRIGWATPSAPPQALVKPAGSVVVYLSERTTSEMVPDYVAKDL